MRTRLAICAALAALAALPATAGAAEVPEGADLEPGHLPVLGRGGAPRRHPAAQAPAGRRQDAGDPLHRPVLQPLGPGRSRRAGAGRAVRPHRSGRTVRPLQRPRRGRQADGARLHVRDGRPARLRRLQRLPRLGRPRRAGRRRQRRQVGRDAALVDGQGRHVRQVLRRRHRPDRRQQAPRRAGGRRLPGAGLRPVPLPVRRRHPAPELRRDARAVRPDRPHAGHGAGRPGLHPRRPGRHPAARLPGAQPHRPGVQRRPLLRLLAPART